MLAITIETLVNNQYTVVLHDPNNYLPAGRSRKSRRVPGVLLKNRCCVAKTSGKDPRRLADGIDKVLDAYESETGHKNRAIAIDVNNIHPVLEGFLIDYLIRSDFVVHARVNGEAIR